jgi:hypothetical protein
MHVELGNTAPTTVSGDDGAPRVTYVNVPEEYTYAEADSAEELAGEALQHLARSAGGVTHMPDQEALVAVNAAWQTQSAGKPAWVWADSEPFAVLLGKFFDCPVGRPDDVEQTHHTYAGAPGTGSSAEADAVYSAQNEPSSDSETTT